MQPSFEGPQRTATSSGSTDARSDQRGRRSTQVLGRSPLERCLKKQGEPEPGSSCPACNRHGSLHHCGAVDDSSRTALLHCALRGYLFQVANSLQSGNMNRGRGDWLFIPFRVGCWVGERGRTILNLVAGEEGERPQQVQQPHQGNLSLSFFLFL